MAYADTTATFLEHTRPEGACWVWTAARGTGGYGEVRFMGRARGAHVAAWWLFRGPVPQGLCVRHTCDNPPCVYPGHLELGTKAENSADMVARGRSVKGERNGCSRLVAADVRAIREARERGESVRSISRRIGVTFQNVAMIASRKRWAHVE